MSAKSACLFLWGGIDLDREREGQLNDWWTNEHLTERLALPGFRRARRYYSTPIESAHDDLSRKIYAARYDVSSLESLQSPEYLRALNEPTPRTAAFMPLLARMNRSACSVLFSTDFGRGRMTANWLLCWTLQSGSIISKELYDRMTQICQMYPWVCNLTCMVHDEAATNMGNQSKSYEAVGFEKGKKADVGYKHTVLVDGVLPVASQADVWPLIDGLTSGIEDTLETAEERSGAWSAFQLLCSMDAARCKH